MFVVFFLAVHIFTLFKGQATEKMFCDLREVRMNDLGRTWIHIKCENGMAYQQGNISTVQREGHVSFWEHEFLNLQ